MSGRVRWSLWGLAAFLSVGVAVFSYRYLPGWGPRSPEILANVFARPWLFIHVAGAATALLVSPLQFIPAWRSQARGVHRWLGRVYVIGCLTGGAGGVVIAFGSFAGPIATAGFATLGALWIFVNVQGWRTAVDRRFDLHRRWMIRSFALTFAAVTLRLYMGLIPVLHLEFMSAYRFISWWSWVGNLLVAELYLRGVFRRSPIARLAAASPA